MIIPRCHARNAFATAALVSIIFGCTSGRSDKDIITISHADLAKAMEKQQAGRGPRLAIIDPRSAEAYHAAHLPGARRLGPMPPNSRVDPEIARAGMVVVYGDDPGSTLARGMTKRLMDLGVSVVRLYPGGLAEWRRLGGRIEGAEAPAGTGSSAK